MEGRGNNAAERATLWDGWVHTRRLLLRSWTELFWPGGVFEKKREMDVGKGARGNNCV